MLFYEVSMIIHSNNIYELKIQLQRHKLAIEDYEKRCQIATNPEHKKELELKLREERNQYKLLQKYIENVENLYETAKNGDILCEKVDIPDDKIEQICGKLEQEFGEESSNAAVPEEESNQKI